MLFIIRNIYTYISEKLFISFKLLSYSDRHECKQVAYIPDKWKQATDPVQMYWSIHLEVLEWDTVHDLHTVYNNFNSEKSLCLNFILG